MNHRLSVYYDLETGQDGKLLFRDDEIAEIAGVSIVASGCALECRIRDCELHFPTAESLADAKEELRQAGFRFAACCGVHPSP